MSASTDLSNIKAVMTPEERFATVLSIGEECIGEDELLPLLNGKHSPVCYDDFEPSGRVHIAQAIEKVINVNKLIRAGCRVKILVADHKTGNSLNKTRIIGRYMIEIWKALGMNLDRVEFLWSSEETNRRAHEYWPLVMDIARRNKVERLMRLQVNADNVSATKLLDPIMRCAEILFMEVDICFMSMDQREVNIMAREYCEFNGKSKPIILLHHMVLSVKEGQKISKTDPSLAIFTEDSEGLVNSKIKKAFCPIQIVKGNPCLEYIEHIVFPWFGKFEIVRHERYGGNRTYLEIGEFIVDYGSGALHPGDVKASLANAINKILQPIRDYFSKNYEAKVLLNSVKEYLATN
ncbi:hypothetical protein ACQ4PT_028923 [Festuca glaucescens]